MEVDRAVLSEDHSDFMILSVPGNSNSQLAARDFDPDRVQGSGHNSFGTQARIRHFDAIARRVGGKVTLYPK
jgi:hypothetical protein